MFKNNSFRYFVAFAFLTVFITIHFHQVLGQNTEQRMFDLKNQSATIRVGVMLPKFTSNGQDSANAETVRSQITNYLQSPGVEIVLLNSRVPVQAQMEAQASNCAYLLFTSVEKKAAKKSWMPKIPEFVNGINLPMISGSDQSKTKSELNKAGSTAGLLSGLIKSKDEVTLEYKIATVGNLQTVKTSKFNAKAAENGQDVISVLIEKAVGEFLPTLFTLTPPKSMNTPTGTSQVKPQIQTQVQNQPQYSAVSPMPTSNLTTNYQLSTPQSPLAFNANVPSPAIQGVKLGMTFEEVQAQQSKGKINFYKNTPDNNGYQRIFTMLQDNSYDFLDGRLVEMRATYRDIKFNSREEFISIFSSKLGLPQTWTKLGEKGYELNCNGYVLRADSNPVGGYYVTITNASWRTIYSQRFESSKQLKELNEKNTNEAKKINFQP